MIPSLFAGLTAEDDAGRCRVSCAGDTVTVCSERSGPRELQQLRQMLAQVENGKIPVFIAPYRAEYAEFFRSPVKFVFVAPVIFSGDAPQDARLVHDEASLEFLVNSIDKDDKFTIMPVPQWQGLTDHLVEAVRGIFARAAVRLKTIAHFGRLWQVNFRLNAARPLADIAELAAKKPDALVMAGPSLDANIFHLRDKHCIWCADTAWPALAARDIFPQVVFSVDAGYASSEHFAGFHGLLGGLGAVLVADLTGNAAVQRLPFAKKLTYRSSHPLVDAFCETASLSLTAVHNPAGDVGSLMRAVYATLFGEIAPQNCVFGHDGKSLRRVSHARGTAYFRRAFIRQNRLFNAETYLSALSRRYD